ncbi:MAG: ABC-F family ATP-binding cassette domain-containing protein [Bacteroidetes bacterium]|nr:ABC-F family ATP-binding cassette domain-containing protein [Bacteroidota bacterium]
MINLSGITLSFGGRVLFEDVSLFIDKKDKLGLVGRNGAGKSSLFKVILGEHQPQGDLAIQPGTTIGHLRQELGQLRGRSVFEEAKTAFTELTKLEAEIERLNQELTIRTDYESPGYLKACDDLASAEERFALLGGDQREKNIAQVLRGLGFSDLDFYREISEFSGGWQMRVELAKILLQRPHLILLDEPTNHLDIDSIQWLEKFLKNYPGAVILISHDRQFLDTITNRTVEISNRKFYDYPCNYSNYKLQRAERMAHLAAAAENQAKQIAQTERFIERFRAQATKARQVQSKMKLLDKVERIEVDTEEGVALNFYFPPAPRAGAIIFEAQNLGKSYGNKQVLTEVNFEIERGDKVAFVGRNGMGKSTLSKIVMGLTSHTGMLKEGHNTIKGYFAQDNIQSLSPQKTAFQVIDDLATGEMRTKVRNLLGAFLFSGDDVDKKVSMLSGGEKSRLSLAKLLLEKYNFLILDEPTNHLDMQSKDILKEALLKFDGTYVVVSHDREFLRGLANKVFEFDSGNVKVHLGGIDEYLESKEADSISETLAINKLRSPNAIDAQGRAGGGVQAYEKQKEYNKNKGKKEKRVKMVEADIELHERMLADIETNMARPNFEAMPDYQKVYERYERLKTKIAALYAEWEKASQDLNQEP